MNEFYESLFVQLAAEYHFEYQFGNLVNKKTGRTVAFYGDDKLVGWWNGGPEIKLNTTSIVPFLNDTNTHGWRPKDSPRLSARTIGVARAIKNKRR